MRIYWLLLFGLVYAVPLHAQTTFGVVAGLNFEQMRDIQIEHVESTYANSTGYHAGAFVDFAAKKLALRLAVLYVNAGPLFKGAPYLITAQLPDSFNVQFLTVPVDLRMRTSWPVVKPYLFGGPEFRFHIEGEEPEELKDDLTQLLVVGNIGFGIQIDIPLLGIKLFPEFRYSFAVSGITQQEIDIEDSVYAVEKQRFKSYMLRVGLAF